MIYLQITYIWAFLVFPTVVFKIICISLDECFFVNIFYFLDSSTLWAKCTVERHILYLLYTAESTPSVLPTPADWIWMLLNNSARYALKRHALRYLVNQLDMHSSYSLFVPWLISSICTPATSLPSCIALHNQTHKNHNCDTWLPVSYVLSGSPSAASCSSGSGKVRALSTVIYWALGDILPKHCSLIQLQCASCFRIILAASNCSETNKT